MIYKRTKGQSVQVISSDLLRFIKAFFPEDPKKLGQDDLQIDAYLQIDALPCVSFEYTRPMAASPCTVHFAQKQVKRLMQTFSRKELEASDIIKPRPLLEPAYLCGGREVKTHPGESSRRFDEDMNIPAGRCEVLALNMRRIFGISPVVVIHSLHDCDHWEVPETVSTTLCPNDLLVFLEYGNSAQIKESMRRLNTGDLKLKKHSFIGEKRDEDFVVWEVGGLKQDLPPPVDRPQRRGGGGERIKARETRDRADQAVDEARGLTEETLKDVKETLKDSPKILEERKKDPKRNLVLISDARKVHRDIVPSPAAATTVDPASSSSVAAPRSYTS